jgi:hypothetical protein
MFMLLFKNRVIMINIYLQTVKIRKDSFFLNMPHTFKHGLVKDIIFSSAYKCVWKFHAITFNNKSGNLINFKVADDKITLYVR